MAYHHPIDDYQAASKEVNEKFRAKYGKDHFEYDTDEHRFWINAFDTAFFRWMMK